jgi:3-oxoacyl-(acyl-carrier-protein) synthase
MGAAVEALGSSPPGRLGIVFATHAASIRYSERFFGEVCQNPSTASPMLFPETVINAPASHLATCLGGAQLTYSLSGDQSVFFEALALAAGWLSEDRVDRALVVSAEECNWLISEALQQTARGLVAAEGAGAVCLERPSGEGPAILLDRITDTHSYARQATRRHPARAMRHELAAPPGEDWLCDSRTGVPRIDRAEDDAWSSWPGQQRSPRAILGEGLAAASAWQAVLAWHILRTGKAPAVTLSCVGFNAAAVGARFRRLPPGPSPPSRWGAAPTISFPPQPALP